MIEISGIGPSGREKVILSTMLAGLVLSLLPALAAAQVSGTLSPEWTLPTAPYLFTSVVANQLASSILISEFRIYNNTNYDGWDCNPDALQPTWNGPVYVPSLNGTFCIYTTPNLGAVIPPGQSKSFTFNATSRAAEGCFLWNLEAKDTIQTWYQFSTTYSCVDSTPPTTVKSYGTPTTVGGGYRWITSSTPVSFTATDGGPQQPATQQVGAGVQSLTYRVTQLQVPDVQCTEVCSFQGSGTWTTVQGSSASFTVPQDSCHLIEFFSTDALGNTEPLQSQCVFVDSVPPAANLTLGQPNIPVQGGAFINQSTTVTLTCTDPQPHPAGMETVNWRYNVDGGNWTPWMSAAGSTTFTFPEDSDHTLEYYCVDGVGNTGPTQTQQLTVDSAPPVITKTIVGPQSGTCPPVGGQTCYVQANTTQIQVTAADPQPHPVGAVMCDWAYVYQNVVYGPWWVGSNWTIILANDSQHDVIILCKDGLGNTAFENETYQSDGIPPVTTKTYGSPYFSCYDWCSAAGGNLQLCLQQMCGGQDPEGHWYPQWITSATKVTVNATDAKSGVNQLNKRVKEVDDIYCQTAAMCAQYDITNNSGFKSPGSGRTFTLANESCYVIKYQSDDNVGNAEPWKWQCTFVDNSPPAAVKTIGQPSVPGPGFTWMTQATPLTLACTDPQPHPVDHEAVYWRYSVDGGNWTPWNSSLHNVTFTYPEDSQHALEYYCTDALNNTGPVASEIDVVETVAPVTTRSFLGPFYTFQNCTGNQSCTTQQYIDTASWIQLAATDPQPHPSGVNASYWRAMIVPDSSCYNPAQSCTPCQGSGCPSWTAYSGAFQLPNESCHLIEYYSADQLSNTEAVQTSCVFVDKTPPTTVLGFNGPLIASNMSQWISPQTQVVLKAADPQPHPSGVAATFSRVTLAGTDDPCNDWSVCQASAGSGAWQQYTGTFSIPQESCHLIEYYSVDQVNKTEAVNRQCVFVDASPPTPNKTVGDPKSLWNGSGAVYYSISHLCWNGQPNSLDCWKVTLLTPLSLTCTDPQPHPSANEGVCFKVEVDAADKTQSYCSGYSGQYDPTTGYCCMQQQLPAFYFNETSEHKLDFYCSDAVGNAGPVDTEMFKVESTAFSIDLNKKWNLISVPVSLLDDSIEEVFAAVNSTVISVTTYDAATNTWSIYTPDGDPSNDDLTTLLPGWGYWVLSSADDTLVIGGSLLNPAQVPPSKQVIKGWNLIGHYGTHGGPLIYTGPSLLGNGTQATCALNTLGSSKTSLPPTSILTYWEPDNPNQWKYLNLFNYMNAGAGYWILATENGIYSPSTTCP